MAGGMGASAQWGSGMKACMHVWVNMAEMVVVEVVVEVGGTELALVDGHVDMPAGSEPDNVTRQASDVVALQRLPVPQSASCRE
jgi:hypothetical protein